MNNNELNKLFEKARQEQALLTRDEASALVNENTIKNKTGNKIMYLISTLTVAAAITWFAFTGDEEQQPIQSPDIQVNETVADEQKSAAEENLISEQVTKEEANETDFAEATKPEISAIEKVKPTPAKPNLNTIETLIIKDEDMAAFGYEVSNGIVFTALAESPMPMRVTLAKDNFDATASMQKDEKTHIIEPVFITDALGNRLLSLYGKEKNMGIAEVYNTDGEGKQTVVKTVSKRYAPVEFGNDKIMAYQDKFVNDLNISVNSNEDGINDSITSEFKVRLSKNVKTDRSDFTDSQNYIIELNNLDSLNLSNNTLNQAILDKIINGMDYIDTDLPELEELREKLKDLQIDDSDHSVIIKNKIDNEIIKWSEDFNSSEMEESIEDHLNDIDNMITNIDELIDINELIPVQIEFDGVPEYILWFEPSIELMSVLPEKMSEKVLLEVETLERDTIAQCGAAPSTRPVMDVWKSCSGAIKEIAAFPNPTNSKSNVQFMLTAPRHIEIMVTDINGKELFRGTAMDLQKGIWTQPIDISQLNPGMYYVQLVSDQGEVATKRLIKE